MGQISKSKDASFTEIEDALKQHDGLFQEILKYSSDGINICQTDPQGAKRRLVMCNDRYVQMSGRSRQELIASENLDEFVEDVGTPPERFTTQDLGKGKEARGISSWKRPDGKENYYEYVGALIGTEGDKLLVLGIDRDITQRMKLQKELAERNELLEKTLQNCSDGINVVEGDIETRARRLVFCNDRFVEMSGYTRQQLMAAEDLNKLVRNIYSRGPDQIHEIKEGIPNEGLASWKRPDGKENLYEYRSALLGTRGEKLLVMGVDRDVTEQTKTQEELQKTTKLFQQLLKHSTDGICLAEFDPVTRSRRAVTCNDRFVEMTGRSREQLMATEDLRIFEETVEYPEGYVQQKLTSEKAGRGMSTWARPDGKQNYHEYVAAIVGVTEGKWLVMTIDRDMTSRREAEEALRQSEERFRLIAETVQDVFWITDPSTTKVIYISPAFEDLFGIPAEQVYESQRALTDLIHPEDLPRLRAARDELVKGDRLDAEFRIVRPDGTIRWIRGTGSAVRDEEGTLRRITGSARDITARKEAAEALQERNRLFESILKHSTDGINIVRRNAKTGALRLVLCNDRYVEMSGRTRKELMGAEDLREFFRPVQIPRLEDITEQLRRGRPTRGISSWTRPDGKENHFEYVGSLIGTEGDELVTLGIDRDITEREKMEQHLRNVAKMEAVGKLAGGIAHDFNNQLTVVKGYCDLLLKDTSAEKSTRSAILEILNAAKRAETLTSQLLAFSREQMLRPEVINLNTILNALTGPLGHMISEDIRISIVLGENLANVKADASQIEQAIMNLVVNASDAMPTGGALTIQTANADLDEDFVRQNPGASVGAHVMLAVTDTGVGIDDETAKHIFEPFFTTKGVGEGTGLGLSMVYGFLKQSGGYVQVQSSPGEGAAFRIYLPRIDEPVRVHVEALASRRRLKGCETILVAEDEDAVRQLVVNVLSQYGYTVLQAGSAKEALPLGKHYDGPVDLLIADVVMPEMSGPDLHKELSKVRPNIKKLYISGYAEKTIVEQKKLTVGSNLLTKPFRPQQLAQKVRDLLDNR